MGRLSLYATFILTQILIICASQFDPDYQEACIQAHRDCFFQFAHVEQRPFFGLYGNSDTPFTTSIVSKQESLVAGQLKMGTEVPMMVLPPTVTSRYPGSANETSYYELHYFHKDLFSTCSSASGFETSLCHKQIHPHEFEALAGHCIRINFVQYDIYQRNESISKRSRKVGDNKSCVVFRTA